MHKFHEIPTDNYVPLSHDNSYLFTHYDKIANFLAFNLDQNFKSILGKPVQSGYSFDWLSVNANLIALDSLSTDHNANKALRVYWDFKDIITAKIQELASKSDENSLNWSRLLAKVFNEKNNILFTNGDDITIAWGWEFNNNNNYKPRIEPSPPIIIAPQEVVTNPAALEGELLTDNDVYEELVDDQYIEEEHIEIYEVEEIEEELARTGFIDFLKWFASTYWWLLLVLLSLIIIIAIFKLAAVNSF